ncbi:response regulator [Candidatus Dependentiae bacterium]|nr:response regulator [Candidatus Dependentiae bacterium]
MAKKPRVMIVDDNKTMRTIINEIFHTADFEVVAVAENGKIAVENYTKFKPDIVTMDILMPEMNGLEAIRHIRFSDDTAKIVVISSLSEKTEMKKCLLAGAAYYMIKPFETEELIKICSGIISGDVHIKNVL